MDPTQLDTLLRDSLRDGHLTTTEADGLLAWLRDARGSTARSFARGRAFTLARAALTSHEPPVVLAWLEAVSGLLEPPPGHGEPSRACFSPGVDCLSRIVSRFQGARRSVDICVFTVTDDRISRVMEDAHHRGVALRVVTDNDKANDLGSDVARLAQAGVLVKLDHTPFHMHHKFALFDGEILLNGSYNWTRGAAEQNEENLIETSEAGLVAQFATHFEELWAKL